MSGSVRTLAGRGTDGDLGARAGVLEEAHNRESLAVLGQVHGCLPFLAHITVESDKCDGDRGDIRWF